MTTEFLFLFKKIVSALILPPTSPILLAFLGLWLTRKHSRTGKALISLALTTLLILSLPVTGNALLHSLDTSPSITEAQLKNIQAIVILGGGKNNNAPEYGGTDTINNWTLVRLRYGAYLQQLTHKPILVTGGAPFGGRTEADAMAEALQRDFHAKEIWTEDQSKDTAENATFSAAILKAHGIDRIALITQAWHQPRSIKHFTKQGLTVYAAPTGYSNSDNTSIARWLPEANGLEKSAIALKEYLGALFSR